MRFEEDREIRGLKRVSFKDCHNVTSSIQESSSAMEDLIWLGAEEDLAHRPNDRMLLNQEMARELVKHLTTFISTGKL